jgi:VanZ family protein
MSARRLLLYRVALAAYLVFLVTISVLAYRSKLPFTGVMQGVPRYDLFFHALFMGTAAFLSNGALDGKLLARVRGVPIPIGPVAVLTVAGIEEWAQRFSPARSSTISDFAADVVGVVLFTWLSMRWIDRDRRALARSLSS